MRSPVGADQPMGTHGNIVEKIEGQFNLKRRKRAVFGYDVSNTQLQHFYVIPSPQLYSHPPPIQSLVWLLNTLKKANFWRFTHLNRLSFISNILASPPLVYATQTHLLLLFTFSPNESTKCARKSYLSYFLRVNAGENYANRVHCVGTSG